MEMNEAGWDRALRIGLGVLFLSLGFLGVVGGFAGLLMKIVGLLLLVTGLVGYCPAYALLHVNTRRPGGHAPRPT